MTDLFAFQIIPGDNDRTVFRKLQELGESIKNQDLIQPIVVRPISRYVHPDTRTTASTFTPGWLQMYQIVAGERRFRAITQVLHKEILPAKWVRVREMTDEEAAEIMLVENVNREDLNPIDEAKGYQKRQKEHGWDVARLAHVTGYSQDRIRRRLYLLNLILDVQDLVIKGHLDVAYAEKMTELNEAGQRAALQLLTKKPDITLFAFTNARNQIAEEQSQVSLFSLVDFWVDQLENQKWVINGTGAAIDVPVDENAPDVVFKHHDKTGDVIHRYIQTLLDYEEYAPLAGALGKLYREMVYKRKIQVPAPKRALN